MKKINNNKQPFSRHNDISHIIYKTPDSRTNAQESLGNKISTASSITKSGVGNSSYTNAQTNPNGFLRQTNSPKNQYVRNSRIAQQDNNLLLGDIKNNSSVSCSTSNSISNSSLASNVVSPQRPVSQSLMASTLHPACVGVFVKDANINAISSTAVQTGIKGSPVPKQLSNSDYYEFVTCATTALLAEKYGDPESVAHLAILHAYTQGDPGKNIGNFQNMASNLSRKIYPFSNMNMTSVISAEELNSMPAPCGDKLKKLAGSRLVAIEEIMAMQSANSGLENKLILRDESKSLSAEEKASNLSGNASPDYQLKHPETYYEGTVPVTTTVFYDAKNIKNILKDLNHVRVSDENLESFTIKAHQFLNDYLDIISERLPKTETPQIDNFQRKIQENLEKFKETGNLEEFVQDYNHFRDIFSSWLVKHNVPMNLIAKVGLSSFRVNPKIQQDFQKTWYNLVELPNSPANSFCLSHFEANPQPVYNNSASLVKPFMKYLAEKAFPKDILFE